MNMNYNYLTTIYRSILTQIYEFLVLFTIFHFDTEKFIGKQTCKCIFFYQKFVHLGENTSIYLSLIIVVHVHATVFLKFTQRVTTIANGIKPGSKVSKGAKIRNRYNQVPHLTKDTNGKVTNLQ